MPADFTHINAQPFVLTGGDTAILFIHGFTGSPSHMRPIADAVHAAGFSAHGILLPGHGTTVKAMCESNDQMWLEACRAAYEDMTHTYRRVAVAGLSMGGILSLLLAEEFDPSAVILFAPAIRYKSAVNHLAPIAKHFMRMSPWKEHDYDPSEFLYDYDHGYSGAPVAKVQDMTRLQRTARRNLSKITAPTLVIQSHKDESVHPSAPELIARHIKSQVKEISWVDRSPHVNTIGPDRAYIISRVIDFLQRFGV